MGRAVFFLFITALALQAATIEATFDAPAGSINGLGWENGVLWAIDTETTTAFSINPATGAVTGTLDIEYIPG